MTRFVVIGALGFLGRGIRAGLVAHGHSVVGVARRAAVDEDVAAVEHVCDLASESLRAALREGDVVVNAAGAGFKDTADPVELVARNLTVARDIALACAARGARLVHISSADVHPLAQRDGADEATHVVPDTAYGSAKLASELQLAAIAMETKLEYVIARPTYVVGRGLPPQRLFGVIRAQLANTNTNTSMKARVITLTGDPEARIDYLPMNDLVSAIEVIARNAVFRGERFHVASGTLTSTRDAASLMVRALGRERDVEVVFTSTQTQTTSAVTRQAGPVSTAALSRLGWRAATPLLEALREVNC